jgi:phosphoserine aminotransferase
MATDIAAKERWQLSENAASCYICSHETIEGVQFKEFPENPSPFLIDMLSDFLSRPIKNGGNIGRIFVSA